MSLTRADVFRRTRDFIVEVFDADPDKLSDRTAFIDDLGADSFDWIELVTGFEEEFDIEIPDARTEGIQTVGQAVDALLSLIREQQPS